MCERGTYRLLTVLVSCLLFGSAHGDLVGHWSLDEGTGIIANDRSGNGNHGTVNGAGWDEGRHGMALRFNGVDNYVGIPAVDTLEGMSHVTAAAWINYTDAGDGWLGIIANGMQNGPWETYGIFINRGGRYVYATVNLDGAHVTQRTANDAVGPDTWHHVCSTWDGDTVRIYVDGNLELEQARSGALTATGQVLRIGHRGGSSHFYNGIIDDVAVFDHALSEAEVRAIMEGLRAPELAADPKPDDAALDILRDVSLSWSPGDVAVTHDVYLGTSFADVNEATATNPLGVLASQGQEAVTFDPGRLDFDQTYYWRVDEVNGAPDFTLFKGDVWSFTTEPIAYPITGITATASGSFGVSVPERTVDGSGLTDDLHGVTASDMWISSGVPATIEYAFDRAYKLHELWVWNSNQLIEAFVGFGAKDVVIEHSLDGANWTVLEGATQLAQAPGSAGYAHNNTIAFGGITAQHVRMTINSLQGIAPQASLSEVRFFFIPTFATQPDPADGAGGVAPDTMLSWGRNGREAGRHEVYLGADAENLTLVGDTVDMSFDTLTLDLQLGQSYAWRVDEVNETMDPATWEGSVWTFTASDTITIDDMERYADAEFLEIWATWVDGFDDPANGALVGNGAAGTPETGIVHNGTNSMPIHYDNSAAPASEATRTFDAAMDWSKHGVQSLSLYFNGDAMNSGGQLYIKINDTKIVYDGDATDLSGSLWLPWNIDLSAVGVDVSNVTSMTVGVEGGGATGVVYIDDILLSAMVPQP